MARWMVRPGLAYCIIEDQAVFLDLEADRYFRLNKGTTTAFLEALTGEIKVDRTSPLILEAILVPASDAPAIDALSLGMPVTSLAIKEDGQIRLRWRLAALVVAVAVRLKLRINPNALMREGVKINWLPDVGASDGDESLTMRIRAFYWAASALPVSLNCVCRSHGLKRLLSRDDIHLVIGVRLEPFLAHCWLQQGSRVIGDDVDEVRAFTPITVIS